MKHSSPPKGGVSVNVFASAGQGYQIAAELINVRYLRFRYCVNSVAVFVSGLRAVRAKLCDVGTVFPGRLGGIQRLIGCRHELVDRDAMLAVHRNARAG